jgi:hypothetical protein
MLGSPPPPRERVSPVCGQPARSGSAVDRAPRSVGHGCHNSPPGPDPAALPLGQRGESPVNDPRGRNVWLSGRNVCLSGRNVCLSGRNVCLRRCPPSGFGTRSWQPAGRRMERVRQASAGQRFGHTLHRADARALRQRRFPHTVELGRSAHQHHRPPQPRGHQATRAIREGRPASGEGARRGRDGDGQQAVALQVLVHGRRGRPALGDGPDDQ